MVSDLSRYFSVVFVALFLTACSSPASRAVRDAEKSPVTVEIESAGDFLLSLRERGELPGVSKDDHGDLQLNFTLPLPEKMAYPFTATFQITVRGQSFTNHYTVQRKTRDSIWQLQRAWRTDSEGKIVKEWPGQSNPRMPTVLSWHAWIWNSESESPTLKAKNRSRKRTTKPTISQRYGVAPGSFRGRPSDFDPIC